MEHAELRLSIFLFEDFYILSLFLLILRRFIDLPHVELLKRSKAIDIDLVVANVVHVLLHAIASCKGKIAIDAVPLIDCLLDEVHQSCEVNALIFEGREAVIHLQVFFRPLSKAKETLLLLLIPAYHLKLRNR